MTKVEIAHDERFFLLPQCFHLYLMIIISFTEIFHKLLPRCFQSRLAADLLYMGKGLNNKLKVDNDSFYVRLPIYNYLFSEASSKNGP